VSDPHEALYRQLAATRRRLAGSYLAHLLWFAAMGALMFDQRHPLGLRYCVLLTLLTVPPVLYFTVRAHTLCRALDPHARTVGLTVVLVTTLVLSPFESGLLLPLKNLLVANALLRRRPAPAQAAASQSASLAASNGQSSSRPAPSASTGTRTP
jgi:hypothetical protein